MTALDPYEMEITTKTAQAMSDFSKENDVELEVLTSAVPDNMVMDWQNDVLGKSIRSFTDNPKSIFEFARSLVNLAASVVVKDFTEDQAHHIFNLYAGAEKDSEKVWKDAVQMPPVATAFYNASVEIDEDGIDPLAWKRFTRGDSEVPQLDLIIDDMKPGLALGINKAIWNYSNGIYREVTDEEFTLLCWKRLGNKYFLNWETRLYKSLKAVIPKLPETDTHKELICLLDCVYNWKKDTFQEHDENLFMTKQLRVKWNDVVANDVIQEWVKQTQAEDSINLLWEATGVGLAPGVNIKEKSFLLYGTGGNGKSTYEQILAAAYDPACVGHVSLKQLSNDHFAGALLVGAAINLAGEVTNKSIKDVEVFKLSTGTDGLTVRNPYGKGFSVQLNCTHFISCNVLPSIDDRSVGFYDRIQIIEFPNPVRKHAGNYDKSKLFTPEALKGMFIHAMEALRRVDKRGEFTQSEASRELKSLLQVENDIVLEWLEATDRQVLPHVTDVRIICPRLWEQFNDWQIKGGYTGSDALKRTDFYKRIRALGVNKVKTNAGEAFVGIVPRNYDDGITSKDIASYDAFIKEGK